MPTPRLTLFLAPLAVILMANPALAHHPIGGATPRTLLDGLLSGLGHPIIEAEHLLFLLGAAALTAIVRMSAKPSIALLIAFAAASLAATSLRAAGLQSALADPLLAGSLLAIAIGLWVGRRPALAFALPLVLLAGLAHGYAYGEAVIGAEPTPLHAYLVGLALIQGLVMTGIYRLAGAFADRAPGCLAPVCRGAGALLSAGALWLLWAGA